MAGASVDCDDIGNEWFIRNLSVDVIGAEVLDKIPFSIFTNWSRERRAMASRTSVFEIPRRFDKDAGSAATFGIRARLSIAK